jgi:hypothetical protein
VTAPIATSASFGSTSVSPARPRYSEISALVSVRPEQLPSVILFRHGTERQPDPQAGVLLAKLANGKTDLSKGVFVVIEPAGYGSGNYRSFRNTTFTPRRAEACRPDEPVSLQAQSRSG